MKTTGFILVFAVLSTGGRGTALAQEKAEPDIAGTLTSVFKEYEAKALTILAEWAKEGKLEALRKDLADHAEKKGVLLTDSEVKWESRIIERKGKEEELRVPRLSLGIKHGLYKPKSFSAISENLDKVVAALCGGRDYVFPTRSGPIPRTQPIVTCSFNEVPLIKILEYVLKSHDFSLFLDDSTDDRYDLRRRDGDDPRLNLKDHLLTQKSVRLLVDSHTGLSYQKKVLAEVGRRLARPREEVETWTWSAMKQLFYIAMQQMDERLAQEKAALERKAMAGEQKDLRSKVAFLKARWSEEQNRFTDVFNDFHGTGSCYKRFDDWGKMEFCLFIIENSGRLSERFLAQGKSMIDKIATRKISIIIGLPQPRGEK